MIDFRYHVVSLVSVFLALAVGIVLGAGPLNEGISTGITDQVRQLTTEKNQLRTERDAALTAAGRADAWAEAVGPDLVADRLAGRQVAVVELPGADSSQTDEVVDVLTAAGATVASRTTVQDSWTDPADAAARTDLARRLATGGQAVTTPDAVLAAVLAGALTARDPAPGGEAPAAVLAPLVEAGLVEVDGDVPARATLALVLGGTPETDATGAQAAARGDAWTRLALALDTASNGAVLAGGAETATDGGAVAAVRADTAADGVSTVDDLDTAAGRVSTVLALREQSAGGSGRYGTASGATAPVPVAAVAP